MVVTLVYKIKDYNQFKTTVEKFYELVNAYSRSTIYNKVFTAEYFVKGKYLVLTVLRPGGSTSFFVDPLTYIIYWLEKQGIIEFYSFLDKESSVLITREKKPETFRIFEGIVKNIRKFEVYDKLYVYHIDKKKDEYKVEAKVIVHGLEVKSVIDAGDKKLLGVSVYMSFVPEFDFNECYKNRLYPESWPVNKMDVIVTVKNGSVKYIYSSLQGKKIEITDLSSIEFSLRDIILLLCNQIVVPHSEYCYTYLNDVYAGKFKSAIVNNGNIPSIIKALLLDKTSKIKFDEETLILDYSNYDKVNVNLNEIERVVIGKLPIKLSEYLKFNSKSYKELKLKVPSKLEDLFKPVNGEIGCGVYVKHKGLLIPLVMGKSKHYFTSPPLICGVTLYGVLNGLVPYTLGETGRGDDCIRVDYCGKVEVLLTPKLYGGREVIECFYKIKDSTTLSNDVIKWYSTNIFARKKVVTKFLKILMSLTS